jgi:hypothetical protein
MSNKVELSLFKLGVCKTLGDIGAAVVLRENVSSSSSRSRSISLFGSSSDQTVDPTFAGVSLFQKKG